MIVYQNTTTAFNRDVRSNRIADLMKEAFESQSGKKVGVSEYNSWNNSTRHLKDIIEDAGLSDNMIALEYEIPFNNNRIDCLLFGRGLNDRSNVVLIEMKQWSEVEALDDEGNFVETFTGGNSRVVAHPCQQVEGYHKHMVFFLEVFDTDPNLDLFSCAYCHNYSYKGPTGLHAPAYRPLMEKYPLYSKGDVEAIVARLRDLLGSGDGLEIFNRVRLSRTRPSKKLLEYAAGMIKGVESFSLIQEQIVAKNLIMSRIRKAEKTGGKSVIVVQGGPGTGKSVIAVQILAELAGKNKKVLYGCKSKPFLSALQSKVGGNAKLLFSNLYSFVPTKVKEDELDVVLIDEAHRIQNKSNFQYTPREHRSDMPQIEQLVRCAKTCVFFIDDKQNVRSAEIGSTALMMECAQKYNATFSPVELKSQFRCNGSRGYLKWVESALGYRKKKYVLTKADDYDFRIFDSPTELYKVISAKERQKPNSARIVAGYCWPWSDPNPDGTLVNDVVIGDFAMPWEARDGKKLAKGIPRWYEWAYKTEAIKQVGCIYTAQGFEFDYIGVIVGDDIQYDPATNTVTGNPDASKDPTLMRNKSDFLRYARNIYRVLMTRGIQGCYVYFVNKTLENYFRSLIDMEQEQAQELPEEELIPYINSLPLLDLRAVADSTYETLSGLFSETDESTLKRAPGGPFARDRFLVRAEGNSMEPTIPEGSLCRFRLDPGGTRKGKIVLCLVEGFSGDSPVALIKRYYSVRAKTTEELGEAEQIVLSSDNPEHPPILMSEQERVRVLGVFEGVVEDFLA